MLGSRGNKGRIEDKLQAIHDMSLEILKGLKSKKIDVEELRKKVEYVRKISFELVELGENIRNLIANKVDSLDRELVKLI